MQLKNTSVLGDLYYGQDQRYVKAGETVEVTGDEAESMLAGGHFTRVDKPKTKTKTDDAADTATDSTEGE